MRNVAESLVLIIDPFNTASSSSSGSAKKWYISFANGVNAANVTTNISKAFIKDDLSSNNCSKKFFLIYQRVNKSSIFK